MISLCRISISAAADLRKIILFFATLLMAGTLYSQPVINSFAPASGPVGTVVTINGSNFNTTAAKNIVYFGATRAVVSSSTLTTLTVTVPAGTTYEPIIVTDADSLLVAYSAKPFITTFNGGATNQTVIAPLSISNINAVSYSRDIVVGDLDGDGKPDIVTSSYFMPSLSVLRNVSVPGTNAFAPYIEIGIPNPAYDINLGDLNGDGKLDLMVTNSATSKLDIYKNTSVPGTISFAAPVGISLFGNFRLADIDGDGKQDIISGYGGEYDASIAIYQNKITGGNITAGSFATPVYFTTGRSPSSMTVADIDGDQKPDVIVTNRKNNSVSVLKNTSTKGIINASSLASKVDFSTDLAPAGIEAGDIDGDDKPDLVICNEDGGSISVLRNTTSPGIINASTFAAAVKFPTGEGAVALALGDIDGDSKPDIAVANYISRTISVFKNVATPGSFNTSSLAAKADFTAGWAPFGVKIVDIDGNNKPEIAVTNQGENYISILQTNINTLPPKITGFLPDTLGIGGVVTITGKYLSGVSSVNFGNAAAASFSGLSDTVVTATLSNFGASGKIKLTTSLGADSIAGFTFIPPPVISSFTPALAGIDDTVIIKGKNFYRVSAVSFGTTVAKGFTVLSDSTIAAIVAQGSSGSIVVATAFGTGSATGFTFVPFPIMTFFEPLIAGTGDTVFIHGKNFSTVNKVRFGEANADWFQLVSDTLIRARLGNGLSGEVEVTTIGGTIALQGFTFSTVPTITSFMPMAGPVGTTVKITGILFDEIPGNNIVYFGAVRAIVTQASATSLTVTVPPGASYRPITVTVNRQTAYSASPFNVTFSVTDSVFNASSFAARIDFPTAIASKSVSVGDVNNDGKPDLAIASDDPNIGTHTSFSVLANASGNGNISFVPKVDLTIPGVLGGREITLCDFDGDGNLDAGMANSAEYDPISYFRNTTGTSGEVSFSEATRPQINGNSGIRTQSADLDGDGRPDMAIAGSGLGSIFVYRNTSSGSFLSFDKAYVLLMSTSWDLTIADFDGDGKPDIIVAPSFGNLKVFHNRSTIGKISFDEGRDIPGSTNSLGIVSGDLDGDGKQDLAVAGSSNFLSLYRNTSSVGSITFASRIDYTRTTRYDTYDKIAIGDLDGDGKPDLAISNLYLSNVSLFKNKSTKGVIAFNDKVDYDAGANPEAVAIGDIDGDGKPELILVNTNSNTLSVLKNQINTSPAPVISSFSPASGLAGTLVTIKGSHFTGTINVSFGDIPADSFTIVSDTLITAIVGMGASGSVDVLAPGGIASKNGFNYGGPVIKQFTPNRASAEEIVSIRGYNFTGTTEVSFGGTAASSFIVVSDTLITATVGSGTTGAVLVKTPNGTFSLPGFTYGITIIPSIISFTPLSGPVGTNVTIMGSGFNGTADKNIVYFGSVKANILSASVDKIIVTVPVGAIFQPITVTTSNLTASSSQPFVVTFPNGQNLSPASFSAKQDFLVGAYPYGVAIGDLDGDGKADVIVPNWNSNALSVLRNTSTPNTISLAPKLDVTITPLPPQAIMQGPRTVIARDLDGDGKLDLTVFSDFNTTVSILKNISSGSNILFAPTATYTFPSQVPYFTDLNIEDFDGDGKPDIVMVSAYDKLFSILRNQSSFGDISFAPRFDIATPVTLDYIIISDIDKDGKPDIVGRNVSDIIVARNTSTIGKYSFVSGPAFPTGSYVKGISTGDINNDGKTDLVIANSDIDVTSILINNGVGSTISFAPRLLYATGDGPVGTAITDLDGDGKLDILFPDRNGGSVSVLKNTSVGSSVSFDPGIGYTTGNQPNAVAVADIDGDGKPDIIISNGGGSQGNTISVFRNITQQGIQPYIVSFTPTAASTGSSVTIRGGNFTGATIVSFGSTAAASFVVVSDSVITATVAKGASGNISVTTPVGTATIGGFTYVSLEPAIYSFNPTEAASGNTVTIKGKNFTGTTSVSFGGVAATSFVVVSDSIIQAIVGTGSSGAIIINTNNGTASITGFIFNNLVPVIVSFTPTSAATDVTVTIKGKNFTGTTAVSFGGTPATSFVVVADSIIQAKVSTGSSGNVVVQTAHGAVSMPGFIYITQPPFELVNFSGTLNGKQANLEWSAKNEKAIAYYLPEYGKDSSAFTSLKKVQPKNGLGTNNYLYVDSLMPYPITFYRLRIVDSSGQSTFSKVLSLRIPDSQEPLRIYPNPADTYIIVQHPASASYAEIKVLDMNGRITSVVPVQTNTLQTRIELGGMIAGIYKIVYSDGSNSYTTTLMLR